MSIPIRRRSVAIGLSALTLTGGLAACGDKAADTPMKVYASPTACQASGTDWNTCNTSYQQAAAEHLRTAPQFKTKAECEQQTGGDCDQHAMSDGSPPVFLPLMAGFMLGQMLSGPRFVSHPLYAGRDGFYSGSARVDPCRYNSRAPGCGAGGSWGGGSGGAGWFRSSSLPSEVSAPLNSAGGVGASRGIMRGGFGGGEGGHGGGGE
jgi:uncharacterized protein YgiB involved in biofilm formation